MHTYVIDMNFLQDESLVARIKDQHNSRFIIPEVAFVEMCKHENCLLIIRLALQNFSEIRDRIEVSISVSEAMRREVKTFVGIREEQLVSVGFTDSVREMISDLAKKEQELDETIKSRFGVVRDRLLSEDLNAVEVKRNSKIYMNLARQGVAPQVNVALRKPDLSQARFLCLVQWMAETLFRLAVKSINKYVSEATVNRFVNEKPIYLRYYYLLVRHALLGLKNGGDISAMKAENELNNYLDMDYVIIASYFDGVLSSDKKMLNADRDLRTILDNPYESAEICVAEWFRELGLK